MRVIDENKVTGRTRELPDVTVPRLLADGEPVERNKLPVITIAPGVTAALGWGRGALLERVEMQPGAAYPAQTLAEELIIIVEEGSATVEYAGKTAELAKKFAELQGGGYAVPMINGTVTMEVALRAAGIGWGDEVIVPAYTFQATASAPIRDAAKSGTGRVPRTD